MTQTFATYTPPKWIKKMQEKDSKVQLEDRLFHFIKWLGQQGIYFTTSEIKNGNIVVDIMSDEALSLTIKEYVNS